MFADVLNKYLNKPFKVCGKTEDGYDCLGLLLSISKDLGYIIPKKFKNITEDNYANVYLEDRRKAERLLIKFFVSIGKKVAIHEAVAGDLLLIHQDNKIIFPAMHVGNNNAITSSTTEGVVVFPLGDFNEIILVRRFERCLQQ